MTLHVYAEMDPISSYYIYVISTYNTGSLSRSLSFFSLSLLLSLSSRAHATMVRDSWSAKSFRTRNRSKITISSLTEATGVIHDAFQSSSTSPGRAIKNRRKRELLVAVESVRRQISMSLRFYELRTYSMRVRTLLK